MPKPTDDGINNVHLKISTKLPRPRKEEGEETGATIGVGSEIKIRSNIMAAKGQQVNDNYVSNPPRYYRFNVTAGPRPSCSLQHSRRLSLYTLPFRIPLSTASPRGPPTFPLANTFPAALPTLLWMPSIS